jgi:tetratricopeptide (TPR) repeat protein
MARDQSLTKAREYFEETLKWAQQTEDHALICQALFQVSTTFHYDRDNYDLAMNLCRQALDEAEKAGDKGLVGEVLNEMGNLHHSSLGDGEAVAEAHQEALEILRETANDRYVSVALGNVAGAAERRGDYHAALHLNRESLTIGWELQSHSSSPGASSMWPSVSALPEEPSMQRGSSVQPSVRSPWPGSSVCTDSRGKSSQSWRSSLNNWGRPRSKLSQPKDRP